MDSAAILHLKKTAKFDKSIKPDEKFKFNAGLLNMDYEKHMFILMTMQNDDKLVKRMGDIIQMNLRDEKSNDSISLSNYRTCIYSCVEPKYSFLLPFYVDADNDISLVKLKSVQINGY